MGSAPNHTKPSQTVEFKGHLIDSLTLSKVADHIEQLGGTYELNDIRIGTHRQDISAINMTLFAETAGQLQRILEDLQPYGAVTSGQSSAELAPCPGDGTLPEQAFTIRLPQQVFLDGRWIHLDTAPAFALQVKPGHQEAVLCKVTDLRKGDTVILGNHGIEW